jgi:hypothetical protein
MPPENHYLADAAFAAFSASFEDVWASFPDKDDLLRSVEGNIELARPIAFHLGLRYSQWLESEVAALGGKTPKQCLSTGAGINRLKTCLMRMPC